MLETKVAGKGNALGHNSAHGHADLSLDSLRLYIAPRLEEFKSQILAKGVQVARVELTGSLASGHYRGPKPGNYSWNPHNPLSAATSVVEFDVKIFLHAEEDTSSPALVQKMMDALGAKHPMHLGKEMGEDEFTAKFLAYGPALLLYRYSSMTEAVQVEYEFAIVREPGINASSFISQMFTPQEIKWQAELRDGAKLLKLPYAQYCAVKGYPYDELNWRLAVAYAAADMTGRMPSDFVAPSGPPPAIFKPIVQMLLRGQVIPEAFQKPQQIWQHLRGRGIPVTQLRRTSRLLAELPRPPDWVEWAAKRGERLFS